MVEEMVASRARYQMNHGINNTHGSAVVLDFNIKTYNVANLN